MEGLAFYSHLHVHIISRKWKVKALKTNLTPPLFADVPIPSHERVQSLQCVLGRGDWQYQRGNQNP